MSAEGVTFIIPAFKAAPYIRHMLDSIEGQTALADGRPYEVLVGVDGCMQTLEALRALPPEQYPGLFVKFYPLAAVCTAGPYRVRNELAYQAQYPHLFFVDADDVLTPSMVQTVLATEQPYVRYRLRNFTGDKEGGTMLGHGQFYIRSDYFKAGGGYLPWTCGADTEFHHRMARHGYRAFEIPDLVYYRRQHGGNLTLRKDTGFGSALRDRIIQLQNERKQARELPLWEPPKGVRGLMAVRAPEPPPKFADCCVYTVADDGGSDRMKAFYEETVRRMRQFAARHGYDFKVLTPDKWCPSPHWAKFQGQALFKRYRTLLYVDADVLIHQEAKSPVDEVPEGCIGAFNAFQRDTPGWAASRWVSQYANYHRAQCGRPSKVPAGRFINSGVLVIPQSARQFLDCPEVATLPEDQVYFYDQMLLNQRTAEYPFFSLSEYYNYGHLADPDRLVEAQSGRQGFVHIHGTGDAGKSKTLNEVLGAWLP